MLNVFIEDIYVILSSITWAKCQMIKKNLAKELVICYVLQHPV